MFSEPLPSHVKTRSDRVRAGFGTIAKLVASGAEIYAGKMTFAEAERRIDRLYRPYHRALEGLIEATLHDFGAAFVLDCHSMPSVGGPTDRDRGTPRPDIVLGDRFGASCEPAVVETAERILRDLDLTVRRNEPYAGASHHRPLRPARQARACAADRGQPPALHERGHGRALARPAPAQAQDDPLHRRHGGGEPGARRDALSIDAFVERASFLEL